MNDNEKPILLGGFGEKNFGHQYRQGNRVYDSGAIAMCVLAQSIGSLGGFSYLYLVEEDERRNKNNSNRTDG